MCTCVHARNSSSMQVPVGNSLLGSLLFCSATHTPAADLTVSQATFPQLGVGGGVLRLESGRVEQQLQVCMCVVCMCVVVGG